MESMTYQEWANRRQRKNAVPRARKKKSRTVELGPRERRRLLQLMVCTAIFVVTLVGKGVFPQQMVVLREELTQMLHSDTDFTAAFANLGRSISEGEPIAETFGGLWVDVFGAATGLEVTTSTTPGDFYRMESGRIGREGPRTAAAYLNFNVADFDTPMQQSPFVGTAVRTTPVSVPEEKVEPEVIHMDYTGPALPDNTTMDKYRLNIGKTSTPALGWVASAFGWREHPVDGGEKFHNGVDLAVNVGTPVLAFADGTVDYIGESPIYGLYLQISHANGIKTFYAHCKTLLVRQGQVVKMGETVAQSGETGNATGPHLHFEIKRKGVRLNPVYYIETQ